MNYVAILICENLKLYMSWVLYELFYIHLIISKTCSCLSLCLCFCLSLSFSL